MQCKDLSDLIKLFRNDGDDIFNARSKLVLSTSLLQKLNESLPSTTSDTGDNSDALLLYDFLKNTLALKIFNDIDSAHQAHTNLSLFTKLKLLEVQWLNVKLLKGLESLRSQVEFITFMRSIQSLSEVLAYCGGDGNHVDHWPELKQAVFSHNGLDTIDHSLVLTPILQYLDLSHNILRNIDNVNCILNLTHLNLAYNNIEQLPQFSGSICDKLHTLILGNNFIEQIDGLSSLTKLEILDLRNNSIMYFDSLSVLSVLYNLSRLYLFGNPISYAKDYRIQVCKYLPNSTSANFKLDQNNLSNRELRVLSTLQQRGPSNSKKGAHTEVVATPLRRVQTNETDVPSYGSFQSSTTANTIIECNLKRCEQTSDMETSYTSLEGILSSNILVQNTQPRLFELGLQDSGIVTGQRPASPDSIGSATSLHETVRFDRKRQSESDIEVLSNPSQSSIEVLCSSSTPICVQSAALIPLNISQMCPDNDLRKLGEEMHRSL